MISLDSEYSPEAALMKNLQPMVLLLCNIVTIVLRSLYLDGNRKYSVHVTPRIANSEFSQYCFAFEEIALESNGVTIQDVLETEPTGNTTMASFLKIRKF